MTIQWRTYPEAVFAHIYAWSTINLSTREAVTDETVCGLLIDRRNNSFTPVDYDYPDKCAECSQYERFMIMRELSE